MTDAHGGAERVGQHDCFDEMSLNDAALHQTIARDEVKQPLICLQYFLPEPSCPADFPITLDFCVGNTFSLISLEEEDKDNREP